VVFGFFFSSRRRHTRFSRDWSSDVCSSDLEEWQARLRTRGAILFVGDGLRRALFRVRPADQPTRNASYMSHPLRPSGPLLGAMKIGRASCRERVWVPVGRGLLKQRMV